MAYKSSSNGDEPRFNKCPTPEEVIDQHLKITKKARPKMMPADGFQAARWWMSHQIPADQFSEAAIPPTTKGGTWETPYHDRLLYTLKRFLRLKAVQQVYVIEHIEQGIPWRGDDISFYTTVVDEHHKMLENKQKYIDEGFKKMHKALRGMQV